MKTTSTPLRVIGCGDAAAVQHELQESSLGRRMGERIQAYNPYGSIWYISLHEWLVFT